MKHLVVLFVVLLLINIIAGGFALSMLEQLCANPVPAAWLIVSMWICAMVFVLAKGYVTCIDQLVAYKLRTGNPQQREDT